MAEDTPAPAVSAEARRLSRDEAAFLRDLPQDCRNAKAHPRVPGSTMKARLKRWGYARYETGANNTGWVLTFNGRAALAAQEKPDAR